MNLRNIKVSYVLLKPEDGTNPNQFTFSSFDELNHTLINNCDSITSPYCRQYSVEVFAIPVDGKCDFNPDGILDNSEYQMDSATSSFDVEYIDPQRPVLESTEQFNVVYKDSEEDTVVDYLDGQNGVCETPLK